jgi:microcystin-dependent protein
MANLQDITNRSEVGAIKPWTKTTAPAGYLLCDGAAVSRTDYADLFAVISTTYGAGNGSTTFNVPDLQGKLPQGYESGNYAMAGTGGANTVTVAVTNNQAATNSITNNQSVTVTGSIDNTSLTTAQLAAHAHNSWCAQSVTNPPGGFGPRIFYNNPPKRSPAGLNATFNEVPNNVCMEQTGSGTGHNHSHTLSGTLTGTVAVTTALTGTVTAAGTNSFSPYVVVNYIIKH